MTEFRNQIVGLVRFSLVTLGDFYPDFDSVEKMQAFLFDEARLARRFAMFEALCLPCLAGQRDQDFTCIFLTAEALPAKWRKRLETLLAPHPWARIVALPPMLHYPAIKEAFQTVSSDGFTHRTTFRLDDDDAVDLGHIARLRHLAKALQVVQAPDRPMALGFNRGFYLRFEDGGKNQVFDARERTPLSVGSALVAPVGFGDNIYCRNHRALAQYFDCWMDAESFVFLRTLHRDNKSKPHFSGSQKELDQPEINRVLRESFGLRPAELKSLS